MGGSNRSHHPLSLLLSHGDIIILSGPSRLAYHAVPKVFHSYDVRTCQHDEVVGGGSEWMSQFVDGLSSERLAKVDQSLTAAELKKRIRLFLPRTRFNVSIRQVEKHE